MSLAETIPSSGASDSADLFMDIDAHRSLRGEIVNLARELDVNAIPTNYTVGLGGIALCGRMPLTYSRLLGDKHHRMSFLAEHKASDEEGDAQMRITLHGSSPERQVHLVADSTPVEFGQHKSFEVRPHAQKESVGRLACDDVCILLDDYIPNPGRTFAGLVDPRQDNTFAGIVHTLGDTLALKASSKKIRHLYTASDARITQLGHHFSETYTGASLSVRQEGKNTTYTLSLGSPVELWSARVLEKFTYTFSHTPWRGKGNDNRPIDAEAKISLASLQLPKAVLSAALAGAQEHDGFDLANSALSLIRSEHLR